MGTYAWNTLYSKILPRKSRAQRRRPATQSPSSQAVHRNLATGPYKILQRLSPKHATRGAAQSPYPIYSHGKAYLSKQLPWHAAGDPCIASGKSWVPQLLCAHFFLLPPFLSTFFVPSIGGGTGGPGGPVAPPLFRLGGHGPPLFWPS